jgi:hypothetical protein
MDARIEAALYGVGDDTLDAAACVLVADAGQWDAFRGRAEKLVRQAWERGWRPADAARMVRRELGAARLPLIAEWIAAEARRYTDDERDERWAAQLRELAAVPAAPAGDRFARAGAELEVARLLLRLPAIEPVGPAPGPRTRTAAATAHVEPRMLARIRALLAKAEATGFPEEAEALSAKAQELTARYSVSEAVLEAGGGGAAPVACRIGVDAPYEVTKALLLDAVAEANHCQAVWNSDFGFSTVVGFGPDLEAVELLYASLLVQAHAVLDRSAGRSGKRRAKEFRQSFLLGYAHRVSQRLAEATDRVTGEADAAAGGTLLPVLVARDVAVTDETERMFPERTTGRIRGARDYEGWAAGTTAADRAPLR